MSGIVRLVKHSTYDIHPHGEIIERIFTETVLKTDYIFVQSTQTSFQVKATPLLSFLKTGIIQALQTQKHPENGDEYRSTTS
jgi:hypothetical protein